MKINRTQFIFKKIIQARWYVCFFFGLLALAGFYSLNKIKIDAIPDITNKQVIISTRTFGMDPTKVEKAVTYPIETELYGIPGLSEMRSISKFGLSQIILIFEEKTNVYFARSQVLQRLSRVQSQIPPGLTPEIAPLITGISEILMYRVYDPDGEKNLMELRTTQEFIFARELKKVQGVAEVDTIGGYKRELHLNIIPETMLKYGINPSRLITQINTIGENFGGGYIEEDGQQKIVRTFAGFDSFDDVMKIAVKIDYSGKSLPLSHIVEVSQNPTLRLGSGTYKGEPAVIGTVMMRTGENAKEVLVNVKNAIEKINKRHPNAKIEILYDRQFLIDSTIHTVMKNLLEGILLVVGVLCLLLGNLKVGIIVASSLLFCILILAVCMNLFGISANLMSMGALDFGLLVDSSVVLVEYLVSRMLLERSRVDKINSIAKLCSEVLRPVMLGVSIIILVYVPILMFSGIEGKTFKPMALNVIIAMLASLAVAFLLMPVMSYFFISGSEHHKENGIFSVIKKLYEKLLDKALNNSKKVIYGCVLFFTFSLSLVFFMPTDFLPELNEGDVVYTLIAKNGTSLSDTEKVISDFEKKLLTNEEVAQTFSRIGVSDAGLDVPPQFSADVFMILKDDFKKDAKEISEKIYRKYRKDCNCEIIQTQPIKMRFNEMLEGSRADLSLRIFGEDLDELIIISQKIKELLHEEEGIKEIEEDFVNSIRRGRFIDVEPDYEKISRHQVTLFDINTNLKNAMAGVQIGNYYATEFPIPIVMHLSEKIRNDAKAISNIPIGLPDGGSFALKEVANVREVTDITTIPRIFGERYSSLSIYLDNTNYDEFIKKAEARISRNNIVPSEGYYLEWGGRFKNFNKAKKQIFFVIPLIILAIFGMLYKMFGDVKKILIIFSATPFALSGGLLLLFIFQIPITISVYVGFIALIGISLLNSIILIDTLRHNHDLKTACLTRLRPILMTATVASLGFLPMSFGSGIGAEVQQPIAITVIGGIISSTIATLILSPVLLRKFFAKD